jgi:hypothetical protein
MAWEGNRAVLVPPLFGLTQLVALASALLAFFPL